VNGGFSVLEIPGSVVVLEIPAIVDSILFETSFSELKTRLFSLGAVDKMAEFLIFNSNFAKLPIT